MKAALAENVLSALMQGQLTPAQQKAHAKLLIDSDEYFELFFTSVELTAVSIQRQRDKRNRVEQARQKLRTMLRIV